MLAVLKGHAPPDGKVRASVVNLPCLPALGLDGEPSLVPGEDYLLFLDRDNFIRSGGAKSIGVYAYTQGRLQKDRDLSKKAQWRCSHC